MFSATELAAMRDEAEMTFDQTCTVSRPVGTRTSVGGTSISYSSAGSYACRLAPARSPERYVAAQRLSGSRTWWVTLPHDADVQAGDRIAVGDLVLNVVGTQVGASLLVSVRALCEEAT